MNKARFLDLGVKPYREVWALQHALHERVRTGEEPETWIFVEHPPVVTLGRNAKASNLLASREALAAQGVDVVAIERGGDVTYHEPGQLVVYPIRRLERFREVAPLVRALEAAVIDTCGQFGIAAQRWSAHPGVWVGRDQLCAVGLAVRQMTSLHGIALNVCNALEYSRLIRPCGLPECRLTSISRETGHAVRVSEVKPVLGAALARCFDVELAAEEAPIPAAAV